MANSVTCDATAQLCSSGDSSQFPRWSISSPNQNGHLTDLDPSPPNHKPDFFLHQAISYFFFDEPTLSDQALNQPNLNCHTVELKNSSTTTNINTIQAALTSIQTSLHPHFPKVKLQHPSQTSAPILQESFFKILLPFFPAFCFYLVEQKEGECSNLTIYDQFDSCN